MSILKKEVCQNVDNAVVLVRRGEVRSPENSLLCVLPPSTKNRYTISL